MRLNICLDCGIKMLGIDTIGLDRPCFLMFKEFLTTKDKSKIWPCHFLGRSREYCHMERLGNLGAIPKPFGFTVSCLPVKVKNAGAGWSEGSGYRIKRKAANNRGLTKLDNAFS